MLLILQGGQSSEGDLTTLALVYMGVGLLAGLIAGPIFGGALLLRRDRAVRKVRVPASFSASRLRC